MKKRAQRTLDRSHIKVVNALARKLGVALKEYNEEKWWNRVSELTTEDGLLWKVAKAVSRGCNGT